MKLTPPWTLIGKAMPAVKIYIPGPSISRLLTCYNWNDLDELLPASISGVLGTEFDTDGEISDHIWMLTSDKQNEQRFERSWV
jgi:hypothetical protein